MKITRYWYVLVPLVLGLIAGIAMNLPSIDYPVIYILAGLDTILFLTGLLASTLLALVALVKHQLDTLEQNVFQEAASERRRFLSLLDHELKNPLTAIMAGLANLTADQEQPTLKSVESQVQRLSRLVADLRKLTDLETRQIDRNRVNLAEVLQDLYDFTQDRVGSERKINLTMPQAPWPLPDVYADRDLLFLAVHNVIDNAVKFTRVGDTIEIRASEDGKNVTIEVADTGPGIPPDEIDQVWGELFRGKSARGIPGSGLGLALVQAIIKRHEGNVAIRSQQDKGTVITLSLPTSNVTEL
ncbi:MAG: HAMP domain-containing sensor histidine kinase [Anaerolineales bacterium]|jgi:two-component system OmpR family sensor kinase